MRGVSALRTTKVNITEDGILQGPAVYSNPSMYFFPDVGDAEGIEVLKGAAAIGNGPRTTAGAINIIYQEAFQLKLKDIWIHNG